MDKKWLANRAFGDVYRVLGRADIHAFLTRSVEASGGRVLYSSDHSRAPVYLGIQMGSDERIGLLIYAFRVTRNTIHNRPGDEVRGQLRYGAEESWKRSHPLGRDIAGVDVTLILGVDIADEVLLGLDTNLWDPLPMGISFYAKEAEVQQAQETGWHVWEKENRPGPKRSEPRSPTRLETMVAFTPDRLIDYARLERRSNSLGLDPALRFAAASANAPGAPQGEPQLHALEDQFALTSEQILDIISGRNRLKVAVRGGVAEHHLEQYLRDHPSVAHFERLDTDAMHDFNVRFGTGQELRIECKNASPKASANGTYKVEVQKTRASKNDPASRYYSANAFDVVAACMFPPTGYWGFRFGLTASMERHKDFPERLVPIQSITEDWASDLSSLVQQEGLST